MNTHAASIRLLTTPQAAELLGLRPNTLELWRVAGKGPAFRKIGRAVRYVEAEILLWLDAAQHRNTGEYSTHHLAEGQRR